MTGDNGERIELTCEVDSNPQALITWTRRGHTQVRPSYRAISISISISTSTSILKMEIFMPPHMSHNVMKNISSQILGSGPKLSVELSQETVGDYICEAATPGFSVISDTTSVRLRAPPLILTEPETLVSLGESAMVWCQSSSADRQVKHGIKYFRKSLKIFLTVSWVWTGHTTGPPSRRTVSSSASSTPSTAGPSGASSSSGRSRLNTSASLDVR